MPHRVSNFVRQFGIILRPWLCFVVYLWALAFQAVYGSGYENFSDRFISAAPLLWTLVVWFGLFAGVVALGVLCWSASAVHRGNEFLCRIACLLVSGIFLKRWFGHWQLDLVDTVGVGWLLLIVMFPLYLFVRRRRKTNPKPESDIVPSWRDMFSYVVVPVIAATIIAVTGHGTDRISVQA